MVIIYSLFYRNHTVFSVIRNWILYKVSQEEMSIIWEVIASVILSKKVYMYKCPIPNNFWDRAISQYSCKLLIDKEILRTVSNIGIYFSSEIFWYKSGTRDELLDLLMDVITSIKEGQDALRRATCHVFTRVAKCIDVEDGIFENVLY